MASELSKLVDTEWAGTGELWLDPLGNEAQAYECTLTIGAEVVRYTWQHEGKPQQGEYQFREDGSALWSDTWHQPETIECRPIRGAWGLFGVECNYPAPGTPDWRWRMGLSQRPTGELVLQMTNITPWGEEGRAVRMVFSPKA